MVGVVALSELSRQNCALRLLREEDLHNNILLVFFCHVSVLLFC